jgi:hypothetical protein
LQRFLLTKLVFHLEDLESRDLLALYENQLWLEDKCVKDETFQQKFGKDLESLSKIMKEINLTQFSKKAVVRLSNRVKLELRTLYLPERNYLAAKRKLSGLYRLIDSKQIGTDKSKIPPKGFIGKGYRDKGSAKNKAKDGSPSWQEVAMHRGKLFHNGKEIKNEDTRCSKILKEIRRVQKH